MLTPGKIKQTRFSSQSDGNPFAALAAAVRRADHDHAVKRRQEAEATSKRRPQDRQAS